MNAKYCDQCGNLFGTTKRDRVEIRGLTEETIRMDICDACKEKIDGFLFPEEVEELEEEVPEEEPEEEEEDEEPTEDEIEKLLPKKPKKK